MKPSAASTVRIGTFEVHRLGFGAMRLCGPQVWGPPRDRAAAIALLRRAYELGHNLIDTADAYGPYVNEELIAEALHPYPADLVIATKGGLVRPSAERWERDGRPEHLKRAIEGSLRRLRLECLPLYQLHAPDPRVPFVESVEALADARRAGKILHVGLSNVSVAQLETALTRVPVVSVQNEYHLGERSHESVLAACTRRGIAFLAWYPLGAGAALARRAVRRVAARLGATPAQVALAWLLARSPVMVPIPGTAALAHLEENARAAGLALAPEDLAELES